MAQTIIQTQKREPKKPVLSFLLSLFFTGLGQMYNGDLPLGAAFFLMRLAALMALPAAVVMRRPAPGIVAFLCIMAAALAITIASAAEALVRAKRNRELPVRVYTVTPAYAAYGLVQSAIHGVLILVMISFFSIAPVDVKDAEPLLEKDDLVLIQRYAAGGYQRGELVYLDDGTVKRVTALAGDAVRYEGNILYVNGRSLSLGYLPDAVIARFTGNRGDIVSELNDGRKYPVRFRQSPAVTLRGVAPVIPPDRVLVSADSRLVKDFARVVPASSIRGRVEGILFSSYMRKIGTNAFGNL